MIFLQAGLVPKEKPENLILSLEPEAAAIQCRHVELSKYGVPTEGNIFFPGSKYVILDCGGTSIMFF